MATYYVDSSATGLNDGSSWTDAFTSVTSLSLSPSDIVYLSHTHTQTVSGSVAIGSGGSIGGPVKMISVNSTTNQLQSGATILSTSHTTFWGHAHYYGIVAGAGFGEVQINVDSGRYAELHECEFISGPGGAPFYSGGVMVVGGQYYYGEARLVKCKFNFTGSYANNHGRITVEKASLILEDCNDFTAVSGNLFYISTAFTNNFKKLEVKNCDLTDSSITSLLNGLSSVSVMADVVFRNCKLNSTTAAALLTVGSPVSSCHVVNCSDSSPTGATKIDRKADAYGVLETSYAEHRLNGANDETNSYSWKIETNSVGLNDAVCFKSPYIETLVLPKTQTITIHVASSASLNNDELWIEVESPSEEATATSQGKYRTTKLQLLTAASALDSDNSTWTGSGVGTTQKVEVSISPTVAGLARIRVCASKPSSVIYVDPKVRTDSSKQIVYGTTLVDMEYPLPAQTRKVGTQIYPFRHLVEGDFKGEPDMVPHPLRGN